MHHCNTFLPFNNDIQYSTLKQIIQYFPNLEQKWPFSFTFNYSWPQHTNIFRNTCDFHKNICPLFYVIYDLLILELWNFSRYGLIGISYLDASLLFITFCVKTSTCTWSDVITHTHCSITQTINSWTLEHDYSRISSDKSYLMFSLIPGKNVAYSLTCNSTHLHVETFQRVHGKPELIIVSVVFNKFSSIDIGKLCYLLSLNTFPLTKNFQYTSISKPNPTRP